MAVPVPLTTKPLSGIVRFSVLGGLATWRGQFLGAAWQVRIPAVVGLDEYYLRCDDRRRERVALRIGQLDAAGLGENFRTAGAVGQQPRRSPEPGVFVL